MKHSDRRTAKIYFIYVHKGHISNELLQTGYFIWDAGITSHSYSRLTFDIRIVFASVHIS